MASEASEFISLHDRDSVADALRSRAGKTLDPVVAEQFASDARIIVDEVTTGDPRSQVLDLESSPVVEVGDKDLRRIGSAFGDMADLKNPFTHGHSQRTSPVE